MDHNDAAGTGPQTLQLAVPITVAGRTIQELTLRRPKVRDLRLMDKQGGSDMQKTLWMVGQLAELAPAELDELDAADLEAVSRVVAGFTAKGA